MLATSDSFIQTIEASPHPKKTYPLKGDYRGPLRERTGVRAC